MSIMMRRANDSESDRNFVFKAFTKQTGKQLHNKFTPSDIHKFRCEKLLFSLLRRGAEIHIACLPDDPDTYLGFVISEKFEKFRVIHFIYVKQQLRRHGVARAMIKWLGISLSAGERVFLTHTSMILDTYKKQHTDTKFICIPDILDGLIE